MFLCRDPLSPPLLHPTTSHEPLGFFFRSILCLPKESPWHFLSELCVPLMTTTTLGKCPTSSIISDQVGWLPRQDGVRGHLVLLPLHSYFILYVVTSKHLASIRRFSFRKNQSKCDCRKAKTGLVKNGLMQAKFNVEFKRL